MAKHAIVIGIDDYSIQSSHPRNAGLTWPNLQYCGADADAIFTVLTTKFGFPRENIILLKDNMASRRNILSAITQVFHNADVGDTVFLSYSGHGGLLPASTDPAETRFFQSIIPYDGDWIYDYRLHQAALSAGFDANAINFTCFIDSCHSGGMHPNVSTDQAIQRSVPFTREVADLLQHIREVWPFGICLPDGSDELFPNVSDPVIEGDVLVDLDEDPNKTLVAAAQATLISACKYHEVAFELRSKRHGALTQAFIDATRGDVSQLTYDSLIQELVQRVDQLLTAEGVLDNASYPDQTPSLRGQQGRMEQIFLEGHNTSIPT
ncbi:caspase family protein [Nonlabens xiamenensis]|uniref:caspase family protein n=1 Tax=Nonlabens xiamenensis TaxID=2341043 RepID=UPI000F611BAD|nr:caspase family protein [Nonlabens xiamenensis]